jgi:hypothetical protein
MGALARAYPPFLVDRGYATPTITLSETPPPAPPPAELSHVDAATVRSAEPVIA